jgi:hypothetical protein
MWSCVWFSYLLILNGENNSNLNNLFLPLVSALALNSRFTALGLQLLSCPSSISSSQVIFIQFPEQVPHNPLKHIFCIYFIGLIYVCNTCSCYCGSINWALYIFCLTFLTNHYLVALFGCSSSRGLVVSGSVWFCVGAVCACFALTIGHSGVSFLAVCCCFSRSQQLLLWFFPPWCGCILVFWCVPLWFCVAAIVVGGVYLCAAWCSCFLALWMGRDLGLWVCVQAFSFPSFVLLLCFTHWSLLVLV